MLLEIETNISHIIEENNIQIHLIYGRNENNNV